MPNLKKETLDFLLEHGKTERDILFVSDGEQYINADDFLKLADFNYNNGFGGNEISLALKVVGWDWWIERHEYDGSEWWEFKTIPTTRNLVKKLENFAITDEQFDQKYWTKKETK